MSWETGSSSHKVGKVQAIESCSLPKTKKQMRSFLGLTGWYRRFVPNFSSRAAAMIDLIKKNTPNQIQWTEPAQRAFQDIRGALQGSPVLYSPKFDQPFVLQTDASGIGLGAVSRHFTLETDHRALLWMNKMKDSNARITKIS